MTEKDTSTVVSEFQEKNSLNFNKVYSYKILDQLNGLTNQTVG
jgi:hypothetical protein